MRAAYITVTMELSGVDEALLVQYHAELRRCLQRWAPTLSYGEVHMAYQDRGQMEGDATVAEAVPEDADWNSRA